MDIVSTQKFVRTSPTKIRAVSRLIRKMKPVEAIASLPHLGRRAAGPLAKVLQSAVANAKQGGFSEGDLTIKEIQINTGPTIKRGRAASRGNWRKILKRMSHIRVVLEVEEATAPAKKDKPEKKTKSSVSKGGTKKK